MSMASSRYEDPNLRLSRPIRLATQLVGLGERDVEKSLLAGAVRICVDPEIHEHPGTALTVATLCNHILRFCPNVTLDVTDGELLRQLEETASALHGVQHTFESESGGHPRGASEVTIVVGINHRGGGSITVNSSGWVARLVAGCHPVQRVPWQRARPNAIGAIAAACLGSAEVFFQLIGYSCTDRHHELSMFTGATGPLGTFDVGPDLPDELQLDGLLVGCGGVANAWGAAIRHLPLVGNLSAVDRQPVAPENIGPYALARPVDVGDWKVDVIARALAPAIAVRAFPEELDLFMPRVTTWATFPLPPLVIAGLDDAIPRHTIQRQWPATLIDLAAGGTTSQVHVHRAGVGGQCLLGAHTVAPGAVAYADRVAADTGLRPERVVDAYNQPITEEDIAAAPARHRASLRDARKRGQLICGRITEANLNLEDAGDDFAPAAPFVAGLAGAMGAAMTVHALMGLPPESGRHWQYSFVSGRSLDLVMQCRADCECRRVVAQRVEHT